MSNQTIQLTPAEPIDKVICKLCVYAFECRLFSADTLPDVEDSSRSTLVRHAMSHTVL